MSQDTGNQAAAETSSDEIPAPNPRYVRGLLVVVIVLGVLLVGGAAVVISTVIARLSQPEAAMPRDFGTYSISIPSGARLVSVENGASRVILRLEDNQGALLIMLDPRKGVETGRVRLQEQ